ncbi:MAG: cupin domain-containing protein [Solirubrobacterales bacterium]|nr:cupin domain-containing protein [Solirubrobacterales bacterium]
MAHAGQTIVNPVSGERITFRKTAADTNGEYLEIDVELTPDGAVPGMHVHPHQEERFEIISGNLRFHRGPKKIDVKAGDVVVVDPARQTSLKTRVWRPRLCACA